MNYTPEEIAELLKERPNQPHYIAGLVRRAVEAEREACAKVCEDIPLPKDPPALTHLPTIERCVNAIRARGEA
jgi:hypothetical protein